MAKDDTGRVKVAHLARLLMLTPRRVQQLANEGVIVKRDRGTYDFVLSIQGYIKYLNAQIEGKPTTDVVRELHAQRLRALQIENDAKQKLYVPRDLVDEVMGACMATVARICENLDSRLPPLLDGDKTLSERRLIIRNETRAIREAAASELRALAGVENDGEHSQAAAGQNGGPVGKPKRGVATGKRRTRAVSNRKNPLHGGAGKGAD